MTVIPPRLHVISKLKLSVPGFFLIAAILLNVIYAWHYSPLLRLYTHNAQRFFHVVHLAEMLRGGDPDRLPTSLLDLLEASAPKKIRNVASVPCQDWQQDLKDRYCPEKGVPRWRPPSLSALLTIKLAPEKTFPFTSHEWAAHYPVIGYLPHVFGAWIGLLLELPPVIILYLSVFCNACVAILLGYYTLRMMPCLRWPMCYVLLIPTMILYRTGFMPDALTVELCFFAVALSLRLRATPRRLSYLQQAGLMLLAAMIAIIKLAYVLVPLVYCLIPASCFSSPRAKQWLVVLSLLGAMASSFLWGIYATESYYPGVELYDTSDTEGEPTQRNTLEGILRHIAAHPVDYIMGIYRGFFAGGELDQKVSQFFVWLHWWIIDKPAALVILWLPLILPACLAGSDPPMRWRASNRLWMALLLFLSVTLMFTVRYLFRSISDNYDLDRPNIYFRTAHRWGIQGSYLLPLVPLFLLSIYALFPLKNPLGRWIKPSLVALAIGCLIYLHYGQLTYA